MRRYEGPRIGDVLLCGDAAGLLGELVANLGEPAGELPVSGPAFELGPESQNLRQGVNETLPFEEVVDGARTAAGLGELVAAETTVERRFSCMRESPGWHGARGRRSVLGARPERSDRDLAAVGHQHLREDTTRLVRSGEGCLTCRDW